MAAVAIATRLEMKPKAIAAGLIIFAEWTAGSR